MTMSTKVQMPYLVCTMSTCQRKELNVIEGNACNCSRPKWKLVFHVMVAKVSWITSWVLMHSLPWTQSKKWIPIGLLGSVHTHWGMLIIEGWGNPSRVWSVVQKIREDNRKARKAYWAISQVFILGLEHDKIWARWASNVSSKSMLKRVRWCKPSKMEFWSEPFVAQWIVQMEKNTHGLKVVEDHTPPWGNVLLSIHVKTSRRKGHWSTINLKAMTESIRAQLPK